MTRLPDDAAVPVDAAGLEDRARALATRSIRGEARRQALDLIVRAIDLTSLESTDTPERVRALCAQGRRPHPTRPEVPPVAAVCVYPSLVAAARAAVGASGVKVASVAAAFPSGQSFLEVRLDEVRRAVEAGADEIDMVLHRGAFLAGELDRVAAEIRAVKEACGAAGLKVILETGELGGYDRVRVASHLAMEAGADFIKTSTGKGASAATPAAALVMLEAIRDHFLRTGRAIGLKPAGGVRTARQAWHYLVMVKETLGDAWLTPDRFRIGASSLLNDVVREWEALELETGREPSPGRSRRA